MTQSSAFAAYANWPNRDVGHCFTCAVHQPCAVTLLPVPPPLAVKAEADSPSQQPTLQTWHRLPYRWQNKKQHSGRIRRRGRVGRWPTCAAENGGHRVNRRSSAFVLAIALIRIGKRMAIHPAGPKEFGNKFGSQAPTTKKPLRFFALVFNCIN